MTKTVLDTFSVENVNTIVSRQTKVSTDDLMAMDGYFDSVMNAIHLTEIIEWVWANK